MEGKLRRGRPLGSLNAKSPREVSMTIRVTPEEKTLLQSKSKELKVPLAKIFRGFIRQMSQRKVEDPVVLTIDETTIAIPRAEAQVLFLDLASKLVDWQTAKSPNDGHNRAQDTNFALAPRQAAISVVGALQKNHLLVLSLMVPAKGPEPWQHPVHSVSPNLGQIFILLNPH